MQLTEFGDKISDDNKKPVEDALVELKAAYETKNVDVITPALDKINEAWKAASEEMYKAQAEGQGGPADGTEPTADAGATESENADVEDVDFEEVK